MWQNTDYQSKKFEIELGEKEGTRQIENGQKWVQYKYVQERQS